MGEKYLIDTNVVINFFGTKLSRPAEEFISLIEPYISVVTHIELFCSNNLSSSEIEKLNKFILAAHIFDNIDGRIIEYAISVRKEHNIKLPDVIIAATAMSNNMTLISSNKKDFGKVTGLKFLDPNDI